MQLCTILSTCDFCKCYRLFISMLVWWHKQLESGEKQKINKKVEIATFASASVFVVWNIRTRHSPFFVVVVVVWVGWLVAVVGCRCRSYRMHNNTHERCIHIHIYIYVPAYSCQVGKSRISRFVSRISWLSRARACAPAPVTDFAYWRVPRGAAPAWLE